MTLSTAMTCRRCGRLVEYTVDGKTVRLAPHDCVSPYRDGKPPFVLWPPDAEEEAP